MEKHGKVLIKKRTKHMNIQDCVTCIKDKVVTSEVTVEHVSTHNMLADYFKKPL